MVVKLDKDTARQGEERRDQWRVFIWSGVIAVATLGLVAAAVIAMQMN